jgi:hypothetical protein
MVYSHAHIGNFRAYSFEDLLQRHLNCAAIGRAGDEFDRRGRQDDPRLSGGRHPTSRVYAAVRMRSLPISTPAHQAGDTYPAATEQRHIDDDCNDRDLDLANPPTAEDKSVAALKLPRIRKAAHSISMSCNQPAGLRTTSRQGAHRRFAL